MYIRWDKVNEYEQHLEGDCSDMQKLHVEIHEDLNLSQTRLLKVLKIESHGSGLLRIFVDTSKESG